MSEWLTLREVAEAAQVHAVPGVPQSQRGLRALAEREGWADLPATLARPRAGREGGGGTEYHVSVLPGALRRALGRDATQAGRERALATREDAARARAAALPPTALSDRQRRVLEARGQVLTAIAAWEGARGASRAQAIAAFVAAAEDEGALAEGFGLAPAVLALANDRSGGRGAVGRSTIYGWMKARGAAGTGALAPVPARAPGELPAGFAAFLRHYARPSKPTVTEALKAYHAAAEGPALTIDQVRHALRTRLDNIEKHVGREGLLTLRARLPYVTRSTANLWPTTIYTADGQTFDAEVLDPSSRRAMRPEITSMLDVATRRCVGIAISRKENTVAVTEALRRSSVDHGIPAIFYTDNGAGYRNKAMDADAGGLMGRLAITKMHALPYGSQAKGVIERFHASVWVPLAKRLPSYIGADMDKEAAQLVHRRSRRDLALTGTSNLLPSWEAFRAMCEAEVAAYNARPHSALPKIADPETGRRRHMSPDEAWAAHVAAGWEPVTVEPGEVDDLFRPYEVRQVSRGLIRWNTNDFFHEALTPHHGDKVLVGYDDADARRLWVRAVDRRTGGPGPLICVAEFAGNVRDYVPLTAQRAAEERRAKGRLARIESKRQGVLDELHPAALLEAPHEAPLEPLRALEQAPAAPEPMAIARAAGPDARLLTDQALAAHALAGGELDEGQGWVLRDCLSRASSKAVLRAHGIDVEALAALLRAGADNRRSA